MTLRPQFRLLVAGGDDVLSAAHPTQSGCSLKVQFPRLGHEQVGNLMGFKMPPHVLDRIEFRRISRQPLDCQSTPCRRHVVLDQQTAVDRCPIPQDQYFPAHVPLEVLEKLNHLRAFDAAGMDLKIESPEGQPTDDGKTLPIEGFLQDRGLPSRRPGAYPCRAGAQSAFVDKDDGAPLLAGLFFKAGHSTRFQRRIAFSLRSTARRSGRWQLKPLAPSKRQT